jgi:hypothetical protein
MEAKGEECAHRSTGMESRRRLGNGRTSLEGWTRAVDGEEIVGRVGGRATCSPGDRD